MKAVTIFPEWVFAIARLDKDCENRGWDPTRKGLAIGDRIALHAGKYVGGRPGIDVKREAVSGLMFMAQRAGWIADCYRVFEGNGLSVVFSRGDDRVEFLTEDIPRSAVVAVATLADVRRDSISPWAVDGQYHCELSDMIVLLEPVPCRGHQMFWTLPVNVEIAVSQQINAVTVDGEEEF